MFNEEEKSEWYRFPLTFWEIVEKLDWKNNKRSVRNKELNEKFCNLCNNNQYIIDYFTDMRRAYVSALDNTIMEYELSHYDIRAGGHLHTLSDDGMDDLENHIVGLGKDVYFDALLHPEKIVDYIDEVVESFAYVINRYMP